MSDPIQITVNPRSLEELRLLNRELELYGQLARKTPDEVLAKKGRDLGIQLFRGFQAVKWGGESGVGIARAELASRTKQGRGTFVRENLRRRYREARQELGFDVRSFAQQARFAGTAAERRSLRAKARASKRRRSHLWRRIVGQEIALRQSGRGVLAAAFLLFRRATRYSTSKGEMVASRSRDYVKNRTGRAAAYTETGPGYFRIVGLEDGMDVINARYGITDRAVAAVRADMAPYIRRKLTEGMAPFKTLKTA